MKKNYTVLLSILGCACVFVGMISNGYAQSTLKGAIPAPAIGTQVPYTNILKHSEKLSRDVSGQWLDYWYAEDSLAGLSGFTPTRFYAPLFPDSTVIMCSGGSCSRPLVHLMGTVLDPSSSDMQQYLGYSWSDTSHYWVDSLRIFYSYTRNSDPAIVDTLVVYLLNDSAERRVARDTLGTGDSVSVSVDLPVFNYHGDFFYDTYGDSSVYFALIHYDSTDVNMPSASPGNMQTFKIPLTEDNIAVPGVAINEMVINANHFSVPAGKLVASVYGFIPGYFYAVNDTITTVSNAFYFYTGQPRGANTFAPYTYGDWNASEIVENGTRYHTDQLGFKNYFRPPYSFVGDYQLQTHLISYFVLGDFNNGVTESISSEGTKLYQNQPNPANHTTLVKYETTLAGTATLEVRDLTGRLIMEFNEGIQSAGKHSIDIDLSKLSQGMYLYTLKTKNESLTRRMIVSE